MVEKKKNYFLDYLKGLACFGVVFFHVKLPHYVMDGVIQAMFRFAIPLFFMVSGYFCDTKNRAMLEKKMPQKCKHILRISSIGCLYYFAFQMMIAVFGDSHGSMTDVIDRLHQCFNLKALLEWIIFNQDPFINIMWFTFALLYCYLILWLINHFDWYCKVFWLIPVLIGVHLIMGNILTLFGMAASKLYYRNFLFFGLPFLLLGVWIRRNQAWILSRFNTGLCTAGMVTGTFLSVAEWFIFGRQEMFFGSILFVSGAFAYALHKPEAKKNSFITIIGDKYSLFIYIVHCSFISVFDRFAYKLLPEGGMLTLYTYIKPVLIFAIAVVGAYIFTDLINVWRSRREKNHV